MIEEEWRENFRMSKTSLLKLAEELRPYIEGKETIMRSCGCCEVSCLNSILLERRRLTSKDSQCFWSFKTGNF